MNEKETDVKSMLKKYWQRYHELLSYIVFGVLTSAVNIGLFMLLRAWTPLSTDIANALALTASILFAYFTNRKWVFESRLHGKDALMEFVRFIACRAVTALMDQGIVVLGITYLSEKAAALVPSAELWEFLVKTFATVVVIIANYVFSKLVIFTKKKES